MRLFPDIRAIEREYFRATGMFPPQHLIVLRREVWERDKWIARALTDAFIRCNDMFAEAQRSFPYVSPWLDAELEETEELMGADFHPNGFEQNRATIEVFAEQASLPASSGGASARRNISPIIWSRNCRGSHFCCGVVGRKRSAFRRTVGGMRCAFPLLRSKFSAELRQGRRHLLGIIRTGSFGMQPLVRMRLGVTPHAGWQGRQPRRDA